MKIWKINLAKTCRWCQFSSKYLIHNEKPANLYLVKKQLEKNMLILFIVLFSVVTTFSHFQALIYIDISYTIWNIHIKFHHKSHKNVTKLLVPKSQWVWKKNGDRGGVVDHDVRHF